MQLYGTPSMHHPSIWLLVVCILLVGPFFMFIGTTDVFVVIVDIDTEIFYTVAVVGVDLSMAA